MAKTNKAPELSRHEVTAVIVTRGNVDLSPVLRSLSGFHTVSVWDNGARKSEARVYGRYLAAFEAPTPWVYAQDDDCICHDIDALLASTEPGRLVVNMPESRREGYADGIALLGYGSVFQPQSARKAFNAYHTHFPADDLFFRECDRVFSYLTPKVYHDVGHTSLEWAKDATRMWREDRHVSDLEEIRRRLTRLPAKIRRGATRMRRTRS